MCPAPSVDGSISRGEIVLRSPNGTPVLCSLARAALPGPRVRGRRRPAADPAAGHERAETIETTNGVNSAPMISTANWAVHPLGSPHDNTSCASLSCSREAQVHESGIVSQESLARVTHGQWNQPVPSPCSAQSLPERGVEIIGTITRWDYLFLERGTR